MGKFLTQVEISNGEFVKFSPFFHKREAIKGFTKTERDDGWDDITYWVKSSYDRNVRKIILN